MQTLSLEVDPYPGTGTASGTVASYGDLDDAQPSSWTTAARGGPRPKLMFRTTDYDDKKNAGQRR